MALTKVKLAHVSGYEFGLALTHTRSHGLAVRYLSTESYVSSTTLV